MLWSELHVLLHSALTDSARCRDPASLDLYALDLHIKIESGGGGETRLTAHTILYYAP
jgi:hypothetical protein